MAGHLLEGKGGGDNSSTVEKAQRGQPDLILLVEAIEAEPLDTALAEHASQKRLATIAADYDVVRDRGIYRLQYGLASNQIAE